MNQMGATGQGMSRDAKVRAMSKGEYDVEILAARLLYKLLYKSKGVRKNDTQIVT